MENDPSQGQFCVVKTPDGVSTKIFAKAFKAPEPGLVHTLFTTYNDTGGTLQRDRTLVLAVRPPRAKSDKLVDVQFVEAIPSGPLSKREASLVEWMTDALAYGASMPSDA
ncbi:MAG: hypothetical protein AAGF74_05680 [Pseudomonadota bacterium]